VELQHKDDEKDSQKRVQRLWKGEAKAMAKEREEKKEDQYVGWEEEAKMLFGPSRKLVAVDKGLLRLYGNSLKEKFDPIPEGNNAVMLLMVSIPNFEVLEHALIQDWFTEEQWRREFQAMFVNHFVTHPKDVIEDAYELHTSGDYEGPDKWHRLAMATSVLYKLLDTRQREVYRRKLGNAVTAKERRARTTVQLREKNAVLKNRTKAGRGKKNVQAKKK
jgi:hypothetical protein